MAAVVASIANASTSFAEIPSGSVLATSRTPSGRSPTTIGVPATVSMPEERRPRAAWRSTSFTRATTS